MPDETVHHCPEQNGKSAYYDGMNGGQVIVEQGYNETIWYAGADDAGIQNINFCPYCGKKLVA